MTKSQDTVNRNLLLKVEGGDVGHCRALIKQGADVNCRGDYDATRLHRAAVYGHIGICQLLLDAGAAIDARDTGGESPLHNAIWYSHIAACRALIDAGACYQGKKALNGDDLTPFQLAVHCGRVEMVRYFLFDLGEDLGQKTLAERSLLQLSGKNEEMKSFLRSLKTHRIISESIEAGTVTSAAPTRSSGFSPL